jgi:flagellar motility protein MotE (MotC chaperone)
MNDLAAANQRIAQLEAELRDKDALLSKLKQHIERLQQSSQQLLSEIGMYCTIIIEF